MTTRIALTLAFLLLPCLAFCGWWSNDGGELITAAADAWLRLTNFELLTAISLWTGTFVGISKIRMWGKLNPALAKSLAFTVYCINAVCLCLVVLHFAPEMENIFNFIIGLFERIFS